MEEKKGINMARLNLFPLYTEGKSRQIVAGNNENNKSPISRQEGGASQEVFNVTQQMGTIKPISSLSSEYSRIQYLLQMSLPDYRIRDDIKIWDMRNNESLNDYQLTSSELLEIDSWVSVNEMGKDIPPEQLNKCEFASPLQPMKFTQGLIKMDDPQPKGTKQYVLCKVAVGKSYVISKEEDGQKRIPPGYHSYYISSSVDSLSGTPPPPPPPDEETFPYRHEYVIHDSRQVLPLFLVQFSYVSLQLLTQLPCHLCEKSVAVITCQNCDALLCAACDSQVHNANKLVSKHKRQIIQASLAQHWKDENHHTIYQLVRKLGESFDEKTFCQQHKESKSEYYCPQCSLPVCIHCKMVGDHSSGPFSSHRLISITEAYHQCLEESEKIDPLFESKKSLIIEKISKINDRLNEIDMNYKQIEMKAKEELRLALESLGSIHEMKKMALLSDKIELNRELNEMEWIGKYLNQQKQCSTPIEYLQVLQQHKAVRQEISNRPYVHSLNANEQVKPDIHLSGTLEVRIGEALVKSNSIDENEVVTRSERKMKLLSMSPTPQKDMGLDILSPKSQNLIQQIKEDVNKGIIINRKDQPSVEKRGGVDHAKAIFTLRGLPTKKTPYQRQKTEKG